jgi:hypothetical protein
MPKRDAHSELLFQCQALGLPAPAREFTFHATRRWRFDWAWPAACVALEQEGVVYATTPGDHRLGGRHTSAVGFAYDLEKYRAAFVLGWAVLRVLPTHIFDGSAVLAIEARLKRGSPYDTPIVPSTSDPVIATARAPKGRRPSRAADRAAWARVLGRADAAPGRRARPGPD